MERRSHQHEGMKKRVRSDRLVGFRLNQAEFAEVTRVLNEQAMSMSAYLRQLVAGDLSQQHGKLRAGAVPEQRR